MLIQVYLSIRKNHMSVAPKSRDEIPAVHLHFGLDAKALEGALLLHNRTCDAARRALAFYLHDMQSRGLHQALGFVSAVQFARQRLDMSRRLARTLIAVGSALRELPLTDDAFCKGRISWSKVRLLVKIAIPENEKAWLTRAEGISCERLELEIRGAEKGRPPREDGLGVPTVKFQFAAKLPPLSHEILEQARRKIHQESGGDLDDGEFLQFLAESYLRQGECKGEERNMGSSSLYQVAIGHCPECTRSHVATDYGPITLTPSEGAMIRCDGEIAGSKSSSPTPPKTRRRVLARDGHRCVHCQGSGNLHVHHIVFRQDGGTNDLSNLMTLCAHCHGMIHDGFLKIEGKAPHGLTITDGSGRLLDGNGRRVGPEILLDRIEGGPYGPPSATVAEGKKLADLIGQEEVRESLEIVCLAAQRENRAPRHVLLQGPPGLGKTSLARAMAVESGAPFVSRTGPAVSSIDELLVAEGTVLLIDEIHALPRHVAEVFYETMDQGKICVVGATTNPNLMPKPLRDRFVLQEELLDYSEWDLARIVSQASNANIEGKASQTIARASMGTPRKALALLNSVDDLRLARGKKVISAALVQEALRRKRMDELGLGPRHTQALNILKKRRRPTGQARLASLMGLDRDVLQVTIQPDLLRLQLIDVTPRGLVASATKRSHETHVANWHRGEVGVRERITPYRRLLEYRA